MRSARFLTFSMVAACSISTSTSFAQQPTTSAKPSASAASAPDSGSGAGAGAGSGADPHGAGHGGGGAVDPNAAPQDIVTEEASLPVGTIDVEIRDGTSKPRPKVPVTLGIVMNSVAKGENRQQKVGITDEGGHVRWNGLQGGSQMSYRVSVSEGGGQFAAAPFQLDPARGTRVILHTYPVTSDLSGTMVVMQSIVYLELKDDRVQVQQAFNIFNFGRVAWAPSDFVLPLPNGFSALTGVQSMSDQTVETAEERGARLKGTFGPGRHSVEFRWQAPYGGETALDLAIGMPPNVAASRVMVVASQDMKVSVDGFPPVRAGRDGQGNSIVETERELRREEAPLTSVRISLKDIPGPGPGRFIASGLAALVAALGFLYAKREKEPARNKTVRGEERAQLLAELEDLERAFRDGEIGPRTHENARRELIDALARTLASEPERAAKTKTKADVSEPATSA